MTRSTYQAARREMRSAWHAHCRADIKPERFPATDAPLFATVTPERKDRLLLRAIWFQHRHVFTDREMVERPRCYPVTGPAGSLP
jgi:hypothetical protein